MAQPPCVAVHAPGALPLWKAHRLLHDAVAEITQPPSCARDLGYLRIEVELGGHEIDPIFWLRLQHSYPRVYFRNRTLSVCVAGVGECVSVSGDGPVDPDAPHWPPVDAWHERMRLIGGARFDAESAPDADWAEFRAYRFVLPAVELQSHDGRSYLACHLRWDPASEASWERARCGALRAVHGAVPSASASAAHLPSVEREDEVTSREEWRASVQAVFRAFDSGEATKAVLSRRTLCTLSDEADPLDILSAILDFSSENSASNSASAHGGGGGGAQHGGGGAAAAGAGAGAGAGGGGLRPRAAERHGSLFCLQPSAHAAFLGCSPERLFVAEGAAVRTEAVAGTRRRGATEAEDARLADELLGSAKEQAENASVRTYVRERLGAVCARVAGPDAPQLLRLRHVQHLYAPFAGTLRAEHALAGAEERRANGSAADELADGKDAGEHAGERGGGAGGGAGAGGGDSTAVPDRRRSVRAALQLVSLLHPTPAVCGQPHLVARDLIRSLEPSDRGWYSGPFGYISRGRADFCVAIRSALLRAPRRLLLFAGAGIVRGSDADAEFGECADKMRNFRALFAPPLQYASLPSPNALHGCALVEECARHGVALFVICPGSRSTPITAAAAAHAGVRTVVVHDERSAAFYALGYARALGRAAAVVVTSGTAVANLLPAAVEASAERVPLLLLTADRPPELRAAGANQAIDQVHLFGAYARRFVDVPPPDGTSLGLRSLLTDVDSALHAAHAHGASGPVHLNCMFREPLEPFAATAWDAAACLRGERVQAWLRSRRPFTVHAPAVAAGAAAERVHAEHSHAAARAFAAAADAADAAAAERAGARDALDAAGGRHDDDGVDAAGAATPSVQLHLRLDGSGSAGAVGERHAACAHAVGSSAAPPAHPSDPVYALAALVRSARRGLIVAGSLPDERDREAVSLLARMIAWPLVADITSGLRLDGGASRAPLLGCWDLALHSPIARFGAAPDVLLQFGTRLVSKRTATFLAECGARAHALVARGGERLDPAHSVTLRVVGSPAEIVMGVDAVLRAALPQPSALLPLQAVCAEVEAEVEREMLRAAREHAAETHSTPPPPPPAAEAEAGAEAAAAAPRADSDSDRSPLLQLPLSEPLLARRLLQLLPPGDGFIVGNSMPIRECDMFAPGAHVPSALPSPGPSGAEPPAGGARAPGAACGAHTSSVHAAANRGASGIDGLLATAAGYARGGRARSTTLLLGDVSALHDASSLHTLASASAAAACPLVVVIVNNGGGGIFSMLPIGSRPELLTPYFDSPHAVDFSALCAAFGLAHCAAATLGELDDAYARAVRSARAHGGCALLEVRTRRSDVAPLHGRLAAAARRAVERAAARGARLAWSASPSLLAPLEPPPRAARGGSARPLALACVHGQFGCAADWAEVVGMVRAELGAEAGSGLAGAHAAHAELRTLCIDLPGHGRTPRWAPHRTADAAPCGAPSAAEGTLGGFGGAHSAAQPSGLAVGPGARAARRGGGAAARADEEALLPTMEGTSASVCALLRRVCAGHDVVLVGYSLGARVALHAAQRLLSASAESGAGGEAGPASASQHVRLVGLALLGGDPGPEADAARAERADADARRASALAAADCPALWAAALDEWYSLGVWGPRLRSEQRARAYARMLARRLHACPRRTASVLRALSPGRAPSSWQWLASGELRAAGVRLLYVHGAEDGKYAAIGARLGEVLGSEAGAPPRPSAAPAHTPPPAPMPAGGVRCVAVAESGHAVLTEAAPAVARELCALLRAVRAPAAAAGKAVRGGAAHADSPPLAPSPAPPVPATPFSAQIASARVRPFELRLRAPLTLARGGQLLSRRGSLLVLEAASEAAAPSAAGAPDAPVGRRARGVGEASPLPGFHAEGAADAHAALQRAAAALRGARVSWPSAELSDAELHCWPFDAPTAARLQLPPSARCAVQQAACQLLSATPPPDGSSGAEAAARSPGPLALTRLLCATFASAEPPSAARAPSAGPRGAAGACATPSVASSVTLNALLLQPRPPPAQPPPGARGAVPSAPPADAAASHARSAAQPSAGTAPTPDVGSGVEADSGAAALPPTPPRAPLHASGIGVELLALWREGFRSFKLKIGRQPPALEAARVNEAARALRRAPCALRLDANRTWSLAEAVAFARALEHPAAVEYIEEPLQAAAELPRLHALTGMRWALDESLVPAWEQLVAQPSGAPEAGARPGEPRAPSADAAALLELSAADGLAAYVIKPTLLGGLAPCRLLARRARANGAKCVVSSAFESGVGLSHLACVAQALVGAAGASDEGAYACHGLNTYSSLEEDVLAPPFESLVDGAHVDLEACERALSAVTGTL